MAAFAQIDATTLGNLRQYQDFLRLLYSAQVRQAHQSHRHEDYEAVMQMRDALDCMNQFNALSRYAGASR